MKISMSLRTEWYDVDYPCPIEECGGTFKATLPDFHEEKTVRCTQGHQITLRDKNGGVGSILKSIDSFGR